MTWSALIAALRDVEITTQPAGGASRAALDRLETLIGRKLPESFRAAWSEHQGIDVFPMLEFLDTNQIVGEWRIQREHDGTSGGLRVETTGPVKPHWMSPDWIPFVLIGGATDHLCIDLDPAAGGNVGQVIHASPKDDRRTTVARDIDAFIDLLASIVRDGRFERDGDVLDVCDALGL